MTDDLAGLAPEQPAPAAPPPAAPADDIEARLTAKVEERIKGFQRLLAEKDQALATAQQEALDLRMSGMSEDEQAEMQWQQLQDQVTRLQQENELLALQNEYPVELPVFKGLLNADSAKAQLEAIRVLLASAKAAGAPSPQADPTEGGPEIPDVDPNNPPARTSPSGPVFGGVVQSEDWADRILASVKKLR